MWTVPYLDGCVAVAAVSYHTRSQPAVQEPHTPHPDSQGAADRPAAGQHGRAELYTEYQVSSK